MQHTFFCTTQFAAALRVAFLEVQTNIHTQIYSYKEQNAMMQVLVSTHICTSKPQPPPPPDQPPILAKSREVNFTAIVFLVQY